MRVKQLLTEDDAVSPVIGVILMVAITVILAAVIASFVLGLGDTAGQAAPQASWSFSYDETVGVSSGDPLVSSVDSSDGALTITHDGGDNIDMSLVTITDGGSTTVDGTTPFSSTTISAGASGTVNIDDDDTIRLVWEDPDGGSSSVLATYEA